MAIHETTPTKPFNPNDYMLKLQGKNYLPVAARIAWLNAEFPHLFSIEVVNYEHSTTTRTFGSGPTAKTCEVREAIYRMRVTFPNGTYVEGDKGETDIDFGDYREKAQTGALGRALAMAGYGTLNAPEFDESATTSRASGIDGVRIVDAPQPVRPVTQIVATPGADPEPKAKKARKEDKPSPQVEASPTAPDTSAEYREVTRLFSQLSLAETTKAQATAIVNAAVAAGGVSRANALGTAALVDLGASLQALIPSSTLQTS